MKYGRLVYRYTGCTYVEKGAIYNIGDNMQTFAVDNLYKRMGIAKENIIDINFADMKYYDGEEVILPMAGYASHYKRFNQLPTSEKIVPYFIGFEMSDPMCDDIIPYLKRYEPIGCRDEATMCLLQSKGVEAYTSGCVTITLPKRTEEPKEFKVFLVDISSKLEKYIPESLRKNCEYIKHEGELETVPMTEDERKKIDEMADGMLKRYRNEASLVVTSRLHAAAPCIALGIPVIIAIDNIDRRFSWLDKLVPIYDSEHYSEIDWNPEACECEWIKDKIFEVFRDNMIALSSRNNMKIISDYWKERVKADYDGKLRQKLSGLYKRYTAEDEFSYLIWGAGVHGKLAYTMMKEQFPKAHMVVCVDKYVEGKFFDGIICKPQDVFKYKFDYALITSHLGRFEAVEALNKMGMKNQYCYFISKDVPEEKYTIKQDDEILLYGFNEYCKQQVDGLLQKGYNVEGIIDQNAESFGGGYKGVRIVRSIKELDLSEKSVMFVMLQNGMLHWNIAFDLYKHGMKRVLFLPMKEEVYNSIYLEFILQYNYMIRGDYAVMKVPYLTEQVFASNRHQTYRIVKTLDNGEYVVYMPINVIRTALQEEEQYKDIPIGEFIPYIRLFLHLEGRKDVDISEYIRLYGKTPYPAESKEAYEYTVNKRSVLYNFFESNYNEGNMEYFNVAAPRVAYNENGYVNLCEGQHRCVYLLSKGMKKVPVRVTEDILGKMSK